MPVDARWFTTSYPMSEHYTSLGRTMVTQSCCSQSPKPWETTGSHFSGFAEQNGEKRRWLLRLQPGLFELPPEQCRDTDIAGYLICPSTQRVTAVPRLIVSRKRR